MNTVYQTVLIQNYDCWSSLISKNALFLCGIVESGNTYNFYHRPQPSKAARIGLNCRRYGMSAINRITSLALVIYS